MRTMIEYAKRRSLQTFVATVPPENPQPSTLCYANLGQNAASVNPYNDGLRALAAAENVTLVDVNAAFNGDLTLIDCDGLHPTPAGYQTIANAFFNAIRRALEIAPAPTSAVRTVPVRKSR
jgi:lysophospholipase L1-like esterase